MRLSELLELEVRDRDGTRVGSVADVVLVQDGPMRGPYQASLRVAGLVVVERRHVPLMGYERDVLPLVLRWLVTSLAGEVRHVRWDDVASLGPDGVVLGVGVHEVRQHDPAYRRTAG